MRKSNEFIMPSKYSELTEEEMEYDGGIAWWGVSALVSAAGWICTGVGIATNNDKLKTIGTVITAIGIASTGIGLATGLASAATSAAFTTTAGANLVYNAGIGILDAAAGIAVSWKF